MKKRIPMAMLEGLMPILEKYSELYTRVDADECTLHLVDADVYDTSDFFFKVSLPNERGGYDISFKPRSEATVAVESIQNVTLDSVNGYLKSWINILEKYTKPSIFDNPARYHAEEFYEEVKIMEPLADVTPFKYKQQLLLERFFYEAKAEVVKLIEAEPEGAKKAELEQVVQEIEILETETGQLPRNGVMKAISRILGKLTKLGLKYVKPVYGRFKEGVYDKLIGDVIDVVIDAGKDLLL